MDVPRPGEVQRSSVPRTGGYAMLVGLWLALLVGVRAARLAVPDRPRDRARLEPGRRPAHARTGAWLGVHRAAGDARRPPPTGSAAATLRPAVDRRGAGRVRAAGQQHRPAVRRSDRAARLARHPGQHPVVRRHDERHQLGRRHGRPGRRRGLRRRAWCCSRAPSCSPSTRWRCFPLALAGVCLGFLGRNRPPATIFMGSAGSLLLGFGLAGSGILGGAKVGTAMLVLGVPILDAAWVIFRRLDARRAADDRRRPRAPADEAARPGADARVRRCWRCTSSRRCSASSG